MLFPSFEVHRQSSERVRRSQASGPKMRLASAMACQPSMYLKSKPLLVRTLTY
jgi:hypothetical protein